MKKFNENYKRRYPGLSVHALKGKLLAAAAMLLVAATLMATASYAWFVLSTAPEVTGVETTVGANGALEIALLNNDSWDNLDLLDMGDIDESATQSALDTNITWGNLVDLSDQAYGLHKIVLNPSRLYLEEGDKVDDQLTYKINNTNLLKTPIYGEDGRVTGLDKAAAIDRIYSGTKFDTVGHGVRAIGTSAEMSEYQIAINEACGNITSYTSAARTKASNSLNKWGAPLADIVVKYAVSGKTDGFTVDDIKAVRGLAEDIQESLQDIETGLRYAFVGFLATNKNQQMTTEEIYQCVAEIINSETPLSTLHTKYSGIDNLIPQMGAYITKLTEARTKVGNAITTCNNKIAEKTSFTWGEIAGVIYPLVDTDKMTLGDTPLKDVKASIKNSDGSINMSAALKLVQGGIKVNVPSGSGILSDIADFCGDYSAKVVVKDFSYGEIGPMDVEATMKTVTVEKPVYLTACTNALRGATPMESTGGVAGITDFYGYAIDLAFRTNAQGSNLMLQTEGMNRIYNNGASGSDETAANENSKLQGGGSYMTFTTNAGLSATKMIKLMSGIRVALMDENGQVLGIAALDCELGQDAYGKIGGENGQAEEENSAPSVEESDKAGMAYYLKGSNGGYQISDLITQKEYDALVGKTTAVVIDKDAGTITAKLYLYTFSMAKNASGANTGGLALGVKKASAAITALKQDTVQRVTAVVYLDGSFVNNSNVAANAAQSMSGKLNLQFSSDANLIPAEITELRYPKSGSDTKDTTKDTKDGDETKSNETSGS